MPEPLPVPPACIFDLDGTLVDSLQDIAEALNHCLTLEPPLSQGIELLASPGQPWKITGLSAGQNPQ